MTISCITCNGKNVTEVVKENHLQFYCASCDQLYDRAMDSQLGKNILVTTKNGSHHVSAGAIIRNETKYLLIKRRTYPFGYDFPGGHVEYDETPEIALRREISEETGLTITNHTLIYEDIIAGSKCRYGVDSHYQFFYLCDYEGGTPFINPESEGIGWFTIEEMEKLSLVPGALHLYKASLQFL